ncbi:hypothetical protein K1719_004980 [Acacia pycnantha]|nr:hypothetical protein K1719_004980 [Acacia pycnantha]
MLLLAMPILSFANSKTQSTASSFANPPPIGSPFIPALLTGSLYLPLLPMSLEWNDEPVEEQGLGESSPCGTNDISTKNSERKEDNVVNGIEENEWDRLLRVR